MQRKRVARLGLYSVVMIGGLGIACLGALYIAMSMVKASAMSKRVGTGSGDVLVPSAFRPYENPEWRDKKQVAQAPAEERLKATATQAKIVAAARTQIGTSYDPAYVTIPYPNGDLDRKKGVCTDVVIRSLRPAGYDLQRLMHEDMKANFGKYPKKWGLKRPDKNIDHRRVPNQQVFFTRFGKTLTKTYNATTRSQWQPGDVVTWKLAPTNLDHTGIVSDRVSEDGVPLIIHNIGSCAEEDVLLAWPITGHFRYPK